jgi:hypothetical protein
VSKFLHVAEEYASAVSETSHLIVILILLWLIIIIIIIIIILVTFMQVIYNYIPETSHVSGVYSVAAVLYLQLVLQVILFRPWNMFCNYYYYYYYCLQTKTMQICQPLNKIPSSTRPTLSPVTAYCVSVSENTSLVCSRSHLQDPVSDATKNADKCSRPVWINTESIE